MHLLSLLPFHTSVAAYAQLHSFFEGNNALLSVCISVAAQVIVCDGQYQLSCGADAGLQCKAGVGQQELGIGHSPVIATFISATVGESVIVAMWHSPS